MSAVHKAHLENGFAGPLVDAWLLKRVMKGIQRCHGTAVLTARLPITMRILRHLMDARRNSSILKGPDKLLYQAAMLLAFFGSLRRAEFTNGITQGCTSSPADGRLHLFLLSSKTNAFCKGVTSDIGPSVPPYCPVRARVSYPSVTRREGPEQLLFVLSNGQQLTTCVSTILHVTLTIIVYTLYPRDHFWVVVYNCVKHEVATVESEHPEEGVYTLPITITVKHMFSTYIIVKGLDQQK